MQRNPHLSYRKGDPTANVRMNCLSKEVITDYFQLLKKVLTENKLLISPSRIYNVDETGIALDGHAPRVVAKKGQKKVRYRTTGNKNQITVIACVNASGQCIPPFVILLLLDGHSSHYQPELISYAREFGIILFCLPPHTTHESQPLDASVFKSLKQNWQHTCHNFIQSNNIQSNNVASLSRVTTVATVDGENACCVCFQFYLGDEEDTYWIQCACGRWLHEDCIDVEDIINDVYGRELFCPYCAV